MLLAIDQKKIEEQLAANPPAYRVTPLNLDTPARLVEDTSQSIGIVSTVSVLPIDVERARAKLLELRASLIQRGVQPISPDDLDRYIDETRGR